MMQHPCHVRSEQVSRADRASSIQECIGDGRTLHAVEAGGKEALLSSLSKHNFGSSRYPYHTKLPHNHKMLERLNPSNCTLGELHRTSMAMA